jgi:5'(3')-deoxyribonucleotidase
MENRKIIKVDIDGVLRDMLSTMCSIYNESYDENIRPCDVNEYDVDKTFTKCNDISGMSAKKFFFYEFSYHLCLHSEIIYKAKEAMDMLYDLGYYILIVSYQKDYNSKQYTLEWLHMYDIYYDSICFTDRKDLIYGDIVIDDNPEFLEICDESEKILIDAPYNRDENRFKRFSSLYDYVLTLKEKKICGGFLV